MRDVYRWGELKRLLAPQSLAIIGVSPREGSFGERTVAYLAPYKGRLYLVNPKYQTIGDRPCYASVRDLPEVPDCAVITAGREHVESLVLECAAAGVGGVIIYASGYAETGKTELIALQQRLSDIARDTGLRIVGPNSLGLASYDVQARISFSEYSMQERVLPHAIGIASQSGALGMAVGQTIEQGVSISHILTSGNSCDVDVADFVSYLADDPACKSIVCIFEGMADPNRLLAAAELAFAADKPLIVFKLATGQAGQTAALSHSGSMAGDNAAWTAAFERCGAILVEDYESLVETAVFFAKAPRPRAHGVAIISTSGGSAIMAADKAEAHGLPLPQPSDATRAVLESHIPEFGSPRNPCDVTAQVLANPVSLAACGTALMDDDRVGALILPHPWSREGTTGRLRSIGEIAHRFDKPACVVWVSQWQTGPGTRECEADPNTVLFRSMDNCCATLAAWHRRAQWARIRLQDSASGAVRLSPASAPQLAARLLSAAANDTLTEREAKAVLASYGVPVVQEQLATSPQEAQKAAAAMGYPVAIKVESADIPHKTEADAIRLGLKDEDSVRRGYEDVIANAQRWKPGARINGAIVQPMVPQGLELMVGLRVDPQFGPLMIVGLGGVMTELMKDVTVTMLPVSARQIEAMLPRLRGFAALGGFRGAPPVDMARLTEILLRISEFAMDQGGRLAEMDVNPLICTADRIVAVDALIIRAQGG